MEFEAAVDLPRCKGCQRHHFTALHGLRGPHPTPDAVARYEVWVDENELLRSHLRRATTLIGTVADARAGLIRAFEMMHLDRPRRASLTSNEEVATRDLPAAMLSIDLAADGTASVGCGVLNAEELGRRPVRTEVLVQRALADLSAG